jgi:hypothetical protein
MLLILYAKILFALPLSLAASANAQGQVSAPLAAPTSTQLPATRPAWVGHTDRLLPIVYSRPTPQTMRQAQQGKMVLRGCLVSACDRHYYCTIHKNDLLCGPPLSQLFQGRREAALAIKA